MAHYAGGLATLAFLAERISQDARRLADLLSAGYEVFCASRIVCGYVRLFIQSGTRGLAAFFVLRFSTFGFHGRKYDNGFPRQQPKANDGYATQRREISTVKRSGDIFDVAFGVSRKSLADHLRFDP